MKAPPPLQVFVVLADDIIQCGTAHHCRHIYRIWTGDTQHGIVATHVCESLHIFCRVRSLVVSIHITHIGLVHGCRDLPDRPLNAPDPIFQELLPFCVLNRLTSYVFSIDVGAEAIVVDSPRC